MRFIDLKVEVCMFFFPCLVVNCLIYRGEEENKKTTSFLNGFAFVDPNLLSLEGPNYKEVLF